MKITHSTITAARQRETYKIDVRLNDLEFKNDGYRFLAEKNQYFNNAVIITAIDEEFLDILNNSIVDRHTDDYRYDNMETPSYPDPMNNAKLKKQLANAALMVLNSKRKFDSDESYDAIHIVSANVQLAYELYGRNDRDYNTSLCDNTFGIAPQKSKVQSVDYIELIEFPF